MRKLLIPAALAAVALAAGACDANVSGDAASVNGTGISQSALTSTLSQAASNSIYACELSSAGTLTMANTATKVTGAAQSSYSSPFVAAVLNQLIQLHIVRAELARRHLAVTSFARDEAVQQLQLELTPQSSSSTGASGTPTCSGDGTQALSAFPTSYRNQLIELQAALDTLAAEKTGFELTPAGVTAYARHHGGVPRQRAVSVILLKSQGEAKTVAAAISHGASFASEARQHSLDSQSAANGGAIGVIPDAADSSLVSPLNTLIPSLGAGAVSAPTAVTLSSNGQTEKLWILVSVTKVEDVPIAKVSAQYLPTLAEGESTLGSRLAAHAGVTVSPTYGAWKNENGVWEVVPPSGPPASLLPNPSAVGASGASGVLG